MDHQFELPEDSTLQDVSFDAASWSHKQANIFNEQTHLESIIQKWGQKLNLLEQNLKDVGQVKQEVSQTILKAKNQNRENKENKENIKPNIIQESVIQEKKQSKEISYKNTSPLQESFKYEYQQRMNVMSDSLHFLKREQKINVSLEKQDWIGNIGANIKKRPIGEFLQDANMEDYINNFLDIGVYDNEQLLALLEREYDYHKLLIQKFGLDKIGQRKSIIVQLQEVLDQYIYERKGLLKVSRNLGKEELPNLEEWLISIGQERFYQSFLSAGYNNFERLMVIQSSEVGYLYEAELSIDLNLDNIADTKILFKHLQSMCKKMVGFNFQEFVKKVNQPAQKVYVGCSLNQARDSCNIF